MSDDIPASRPSKIRPRHLQLLAINYVRQSSIAQVRDHEGSAAAQRDLAELPRRWGWSEAQLLTIDADQGFSATSSTKRTGFQQMLDLVNKGEVGIIIVRELSRLSRHPVDTLQILWATKRTGTLIYDGTLRDPAHETTTELFGLQLSGLLGWMENENRAKAVMTARIAKARRGHAVSGAPIGYVRTATGGWEKDTDIDVQNAVGRVFTLYRDLGSLGRVTRYLEREHLEFPRRRRGELTWGGLDPAHLYNILTSRAYVGDYVFRYKTRPEAENSPADDSEDRQEIVLKDHHEPYVDRPVWQAIQEMLTARTTLRRPIVGKGTALLQGLLRCGADCNRWMRTQYWGHNGQARTATYVCRRTDLWGKETHRITCLARFVDHAVVREVLKVLRPPELRVAVTTLEQTRADEGALEQTRRRQLEHAEHEVARARQAYERASTKHQRVRADLLDRYESALGTRDKMKEAASAPPPVTPRLTQGDVDELLELTSEAEDLWAAPTTTNEDRKRLLRMLLAEVVVVRANKEAIDLEMVWVDGTRESLRVPRAKGVDAMVRDKRLEGKSPTVITEELRAAGVITARGRPISLNVVSQKLGSAGLRPKHERKIAREIIRQGLLVDNLSRSEIRRRLDAQAPGLGPWTSRRLSEAIRQLRIGPPGVEPLPAVLPAEEAKAKILALIDEMLAAGDNWKAAADRLNELGFKPPRGDRFTRAQVRFLYRAAHLETMPRLPLGRPRKAQR